jgi:hypothetical protein
LDVGITGKGERALGDPAAAFVEFFNITFNNAVASRLSAYE